MRSILLAILILSAVPAVHSAPPTSSLLFQLSPDSGGAQTLISWTLSGPIKDSFALSGGSWTGIGSLFDGAFNSSYFTDSSAETFAVAGAGSFSAAGETSSLPVAPRRWSNSSTSDARLDGKMPSESPAL